MGGGEGGQENTRVFCVGEGLCLFVGEGTESFSVLSSFCRTLSTFKPTFNFFLVATGFYPICRCRLSAHACGFNMLIDHLDFVISSLIPQPYNFPLHDSTLEGKILIF